ncbi:hypothetical protein [Vibrio furnissii]|uniref:hypothetical protein n=1 Tax=Vibrio furnissii TaxID=29494 RepID=UPI001559249E|nr:hypothetical protein [Vibrio furnissii]
MPLSPETLTQSIIANLNSKGFVTEGKFAKSGDFAAAIAQAVVEEITKNAVVIITKGDSAGEYKIT